MSLTMLFPNQSLVLNAYASLIGATPGNHAYVYHMDYIEQNGAANYTAALNGIFAGWDNSMLATAMLTNLGLTSVFTQAQAEAYLALRADNRVAGVLDVANYILTYSGTDAGLLAAKTAYQGEIDGSYAYSINPSNTMGAELAGFNGHTYNLTTAIDHLTGTAGADTFIAYIENNANTLQSHDVINGGAGIDTLLADVGASANFSITAETTNVEIVKVRAQSYYNDGADNNVVPTQIDAQRMVGVTTWEDTNSRGDLLIEDVRIGDAQKTKDITIAMVETDPGNVDYGVYFDQHSLRNASSGNSILNIKVMDTGAAGSSDPLIAATPLLNNPYDQFKVGINGVLVTIQLDKVAVAAADTYAALLTVFQTAVTTMGLDVTVTLGDPFTITDPISNNPVTGQSIVLTGGAGAIISSPASSGWYNTTGASVPPTSNMYTTYTTGANSTTELVTSTVILDDVGRGSTGGDLVIGGLSVGETSTSRGVERFEIEVRDNSKLQTINSTNNALREVTIVSGATSKTDATDGAYSTTVLNEGDLTVNGNAKNSLGVDQGDGILPFDRSNQTMQGVNEGATAVHQGINAAGFTDVRLIDASAFLGKLAFTAAITEDSLGKYVDLSDSGNNPQGDVAGAGNVNFNVKGANFIYTGGNDNDTMVVNMDTTIVASNMLTGQSDFTMVLNGGAGNDALTVSIAGAQTANWYLNQKDNANITINAGDGKDVVKTLTSGDFIINAGLGDDTVYVDNSGAKAAWIVNADLVAPGDLDDLLGGIPESQFLYKGQLVVSFTGAAAGGGVTAGAADSVAAAYTNGFEVVVDIPTGANYVVTQYHINQAIKKAINDDAVLSTLLTAADGPNRTLVITSDIDGAFANDDLSITIKTQTLTAAEETSALTALKTVMQDSTLTAPDVSLQNTASVALFNALEGFTAAGTGADSVLGTVLGVDVTGARSVLETDNHIDLGSGSDVVVLGTSLLSNDTLVFTGTDIGKDTIVNFTTGAGVDADLLDFTSYLTNGISASGSVESSVRIATNLNALNAIAVDANSVTIFDSFAAVGTETWAAMTGANLMAAINSTNAAGAADYGNFTVGTIDGAVGYIASGAGMLTTGGIGHGIIMVENAANEGEYKVFALDWNGAAAGPTAGDFSAVTLLGVVDFGASIDATLALGNLV